MSAAVPWPDLRARVQLLGPWHEAWLASVIEDRDGHEIQLAVPQAPGTIVPVVGRPGDVVTVHWVCARGQADVDCRLVEVARRTLASWHVHAMADPVVRQRRQFVRAKLHMPVTVVTPTDGVGLRGWVVDLSEGGVRLVTVGSDLGGRQRTLLRFEIDGQEVLVQGEVLRAWPDQDGYATVAVRFVELHHRDADRIRRMVFSAQVRTLAVRR